MNLDELCANPAKSQGVHLTREIAEVWFARCRDLVFDQMERGLIDKLADGESMDIDISPQVSMSLNGTLHLSLTLNDETIRMDVPPEGWFVTC